MSNNNLFVIGKPAGIYKFTSLPLLKIAQVENTILFDDKRFIVGRILGTEESSIIRNIEPKHILIVTISGFIISVKKDDICLEPSSKMDAFLKEQEFLYVSQKLKPYNGKLTKIDDNNWYIQI